MSLHHDFGDSVNSMVLNRHDWDLLIFAHEIKDTDGEAQVLLLTPLLKELVEYFGNDLDVDEFFDVFLSCDG